MTSSIDEQQIADAERINDRRGSRRHSTVLLVGQVRRAGVAAMCLVHDISPDGLMARFTEVPVLGEELEDAVRGLPFAAGRVRWVRGYRAGIAFIEKQDVSGVLGRGSGRVARAPRFDVALATELGVGADRHVVEMVDLSPGGAKLIVDNPLEPGTPVHLSLPGGTEQVPATVCWMRGAHVGLRFAVPLEMGTLARVIALDDGIR